MIAAKNERSYFGESKKDDCLSTNYHIAYYVSLLDGFDADNEGIWSFKVWKFDGEEPEPVDWYDNEWLDGIHIFEEES